MSELTNNIKRQQILTAEEKIIQRLKEKGLVNKEEAKMYSGKEVAEMMKASYRAGTKWIDLNKLQSVLYNVQQVMAGYSQDDTWSDYDKKAHTELIEMQYLIETEINNSQPGASFGYSLSLTEIEGLKKDNERLKLLIEKSHYTGYNDGKYNGNYKYTITESFNLFKSENNI